MFVATPPPPLRNPRLLSVAMFMGAPVRLVLDELLPTPPLVPRPATATGDSVAGRNGRAKSRHTSGDCGATRQRTRWVCVCVCANAHRTCRQCNPGSTPPVTTPSTTTLAPVRPTARRSGPPPPRLRHRARRATSSWRPPPPPSRGTRSAWCWEPPRPTLGLASLVGPVGPSDRAALCEPLLLKPQVIGKASGTHAGGGGGG